MTVYFWIAKGNKWCFHKYEKIYLWKNKVNMLKIINFYSYDNYRMTDYVTYVMQIFFVHCESSAVIY